jgi:hypothetical protein
LSWEKAETVVPKATPVSTTQQENSEKDAKGFTVRSGGIVENLELVLKIFLVRKALSCWYQNFHMS